MIQCVSKGKISCQSPINVVSSSLICNFQLVLLDFWAIDCLFLILASLTSSITVVYIYTGRFIMFSVITNIYNKKTKGPSLMEFFTATGKLKKFFF